MENNLIIAGVDEVGRGCLAGPVVSAAVILNDKINLKLIKDSKKINCQNRLPCWQKKRTRFGGGEFEGGDMGE